MNHRLLRKRFAKRFLALTAATVLSCAAVNAKPVMLVDAPISRLLVNVAAYVKQHPQDSNGYYTLGRIHYFAFAAPTRQTMPVIRYNDKALPYTSVLGNPGRIVAGARSSDDKATQTPDQRKNHVQAAIRNLQQAIRLEQRRPAADELKRDGLSELTLACVYEEGKHDAAAIWQEEAIRYYRRAYERSSAQELKEPRTPFLGVQTLVSYEAAQSYLHLVRLRGVRPDEKKTVAAVEQTVKRLASLPPSNVVTPLIFSLNRARPLSMLVASRPEGVAFDLDGSARAGQVYGAWPRADTGILVWDPTHTGQITSGRQLFGNATWWIFWENGYRALQSLDDDQDGWLTAKELDNLGVWNDVNVNGKCESGEVRPLSQTGIVGLNVREAQPAGRGWVCKNGLRLQNGTVLPTYDWTVNTISAK